MTISKLDNRADLPPDLGAGGLTRLSEVERATFAKRYIDHVVQSGTTRYPPGRSLPEFFELVQNAVRSRETYERVPSGKNILVIGEDPPSKEIDTEAITFFLKTRAPGQWNKGPAGSARVKEIVYHARSVQQHPEHPGEKLVTMGRRHDNWVQFNIYAKTDKVALARVLWFENLMDSFRWYFNLYRITNVLYQGTGSREKEKVGNLKLVKYPMTFFLQTEEIYQFGSQELQQILLNLEISTE